MWNKRKKLYEAAICIYDRDVIISCFKVEEQQF